MADEGKVVIPLDFVSNFDNGRYGRKVGDMIWKKLEREGGFLIPETMLDVRDTCQSKDLHPAPDLSLEKMKKIVQDNFGAHVGIFGSVERAPGHDFDVYDLVIKCVDFTAYPEAKVIYQCKARTNSVRPLRGLRRDAQLTTMAWAGIANWARLAGLSVYHSSLCPL